MEDVDIFERLSFYLKGDEMAVSFAVDLIWLSDYCDDLYDGDVPRTKEEVKLAFRKVFVDLPANPFFQKWQKELSTLMASAYLMWCDSTHFEKGDTEQRFIAFQIRNALMNVLHHCIFLCGGSEWAEEQGPAFWEYFAPKLEKWKELITE